MQPINDTNVHSTQGCSNTITNGNRFSYLYASVIENVAPSFDCLKEDPVTTILAPTMMHSQTPGVFNLASLGKTSMLDTKSSYMHELLKILSSVPMG